MLLGLAVGNTGLFSSDLGRVPACRIWSKRRNHPSHSSASTAPNRVNVSIPATEIVIA